MFNSVGGFLLILVVIIYAIGFVQNSIHTTRQIIDAWENGLPPLREGYIPPSKRKIEGVMFVPEGEDPAKYIKP